MSHSMHLSCINIMWACTMDASPPCWCMRKKNAAWSHLRLMVENILLCNRGSSGVHGITVRPIGAVHSQSDLSVVANELLLKFADKLD